MIIESELTEKTYKEYIKNSNKRWNYYLCIVNYNTYTMFFLS